MSIADLKYQQFLQYVQSHGEARNTRSGTVFSCFSPPELRFENVGTFFPLLTLKKMRIASVIGELLWFLNGRTDLPSLRTFSNLPPDANTIWSADAERWWSRMEEEANIVESWQRNRQSLGAIYGIQWRYARGQYSEDEEESLDQISRLVRSLRTDPNGRYHIVTSYDPYISMERDMTALPPCHMFLQCYVQNNKLHLKWYQRSVDTVLGLPYNIASYAALLLILAKLTGYEAGDIIGTFGDAHIYEAHTEAVTELLARDSSTYNSPHLSLPEFTEIWSMNAFTANDFTLRAYESYPAVSAPLMVG